MTALGSLGIDDDAERLYRQALRHDGSTLDEHVDRLGWTPERTRAALAPLLQAQLVREDVAGRLTAPHPRTALTRLLEREQARVDLRRRELEDVAAVVGDYSADHLAGRTDAVDPAALDAVPAELVAPTVEEVLRSTSGVIRSCHLEVGAGPAADAGVDRDARRLVARGRELRSVYPADVLDHEERLAWVRGWAAAGERQRVVERVPAEFTVFGTEAVIAGPVWGRPVSSAVLLRMPLLVAAFTAVFDDAWRSGLPVPDEGLEQDAETRLLALLGTGFKDEAIARYLGLGLRTVRRRVAVLMDEHGVHTRFQLGAVAERRGLLRRRSD
ncbi:hypothetical protein GCM10028814_01070 [Angustibacter aerolatus]